VLEGDWTLLGAPHTALHSASPPATHHRAGVGKVRDAQPCLPHHGIIRGCRSPAACGVPPRLSDGGAALQRPLPPRREPGVRALSLRRAHAAAAPGARHAHSTVMVSFFLASLLTPHCGATAAALGPKHILMLMQTSRSLTQCIDNLDGADGPGGWQQWQRVGIQASLSAGKPASRPPETGAGQLIGTPRLSK
jgi:hypothetical protein